MVKHVLGSQLVNSGHSNLVRPDSHQEKQSNIYYVDGEEGAQSHSDPITETESVSPSLGCSDGEYGGADLLREEREAGVDIVLDLLYI